MAEKATVKENLQKAAEYIAKALEESDCPVCDKFLQQEMQLIDNVLEMYDQWRMASLSGVRHSTGQKTEEKDASSQSRKNRGILGGSGPLRQFMQGRPRLTDLLGSSKGTQ